MIFMEKGAQEGKTAQGPESHNVALIVELPN